MRTRKTAHVGMRRRSRSAQATAAVILAAMATRAKAVTYTWANTGNSWNSNANWLPSTGFPGTASNDLALFNSVAGASGSNPTLSASETIARLKFGSTTASGYTVSSTGLGVTLSLSALDTGLALEGDNTSGTNTVAAPLIFAGTANGQQDISQASGGTLNITGVIGSTNSITLALKGTGTVLFSNAGNSYTGTTSLASGTLAFVSGALSSSNVNFSGGGLQFLAGNTLDISSRLTASTGSINLDLNGNNVTFASSIGSANTAGIVLSNTSATVSTLTLSGSNSYAGNTTVGTRTAINLGNANAIGAGVLVFSGSGTFDNTSGAGITLGNGIQFSGGSGTFLGSNAATFGGTGTISGANRTITVNASTLALTGNVGENTAGLGLTKAGAGTLTLAGSNTYSGGTTLTAGQLNINNNNALGTGAFSYSSATTLDNTSGAPVTVPNVIATLNNLNFGGSNPLTFSNTGNLAISTVRAVNLNGTTLANNVLTFAGQLQNTNATTTSTVSLTAAGAGTLVLGSVALNTAGSATIQFSGTSNVSVNGAVIDGSFGAGNLRSGVPLLTLNAPALAYTGTTTITGGTFNVVNGTLATSSIVIANTSLYEGNSSSNAPIALQSGGSILPGSATAVGAISTTGSFAITGTGAGSIDIVVNPSGPSPTASQLTAASVNLAAGVGAGTASLIVSELSPVFLPNGTKFTIVNNTGATAVNGVFSNLVGGFVSDGINNYLVSYTDNSGGDGNFNDITLTSVAPEPSCAIFLGLGVGYPMLRRRRQTKVSG